MIPKFRCWDKPNKIMRFNDEIVIWNDQVYINRKKELDSKIKGYSCLSEHLMQSTGLKDKNGVEIFEGDVDRSESGEISVIVYLIKAGSYCVMPLEIYLNEDFQNANFFPELLYNFGYDCTFDNQISEKYLNIVGNIYENPELFEVSE